MKTKAAVLNGNLGAENSSARFDKGGVAWTKPGRKSLLRKTALALSVAAAGCLTVFGETVDSFSHDGQVTNLLYCGEFLPSQAQGKEAVIFENARLCDYEAYDMMFSGNPAHRGAYVDKSAVGIAYTQTRTETDDHQNDELVVQFIYNGMVQYVIVRFRQDGANIVGQVVKSGYFQQSPYFLPKLADDVMKYSAADGHQNMTIRTSDDMNGYGVDYIRFVVRERGRRTASEEMTGLPPATVTLNHAELVAHLAADAVLEDSGTFAGTESTISYVTPEMESTREEGAFEWTTDAVVPKSAKTVRVPGIRVADIVGASGGLAGGWLASSTVVPSPGYFFTNDGFSASCQFQTQLANKDLKEVHLEMTQDGADVVLNSPHGYYFSGSSYPPGEHKFVSGDPEISKIATSQTGEGYCILGVTLQLKAKTNYLHGTSLTLSRATEATAAGLRFAGTENCPLGVESTADAVHFTDNLKEVVVGPYAALTLSNPGGIASGNGNRAKWRVFGRSTLTITRNWCFPTSAELELDDSRVYFNQPSGEGNVYIGGLHYVNGSESFGGSPRIGLKNTAAEYITASGVGPCVMHHGLGFTSGDKNRPVIFDIADTTSSPEPDLTVEGPLFFTAGFDSASLWKNGAGTLRLEGKCTFGGSPSVVRQGTLELAANCFDNASMDLMFRNAPSFVLDAGTANVFGKLTILGQPSWTVGDGARLAFASADGWAAGATLAITASEEDGKMPEITFASGLTSAQLAAIRWNGRRCLMEEGRLLPRPHGTLIIMR